MIPLDLDGEPHHCEPKDHKYYPWSGCGKMLYKDDKHKRLIRVCRICCNDMRSRNGLIDIVLIEG